MSDFSAVLWDLDGTIVDTEPLWMAAETELAAAHGREWTLDDALALVGSDLMDAGRTIQAKLGLPIEPAEVVEYLTGRVVDGLSGDVPWRPGAVELIESLSAEGVPQALVTMSYQNIAAPIAAQLPFGAVVTGDLVDNGKPHPEPYLAAAAQLGVNPGECLAIEDSPTGAASAGAAGCLVLAVPHVVQIEPGERRAFLPSLEGVTPSQLRALTH